MDCLGFLKKKRVDELEKNMWKPSEGGRGFLPVRADTSTSLSLLIGKCSLPCLVSQRGCKPVGAVEDFATPSLKDCSLECSGIHFQVDGGVALPGISDFIDI